MNPRRRYDPDGRHRRERKPGAGCAAGLLWLALPLALALSYWMLRGTLAASNGTGTAPEPSRAAVMTVTPAPASPTGPASATPAPSEEPPLPTSTLLPEPSPSPTAIQTAVPTEYYVTQSGDTLPALAARFGVNPADILPVDKAGLRGGTILASGQMLIIPQVLAETGPGDKIIPDSEMVFSGAAAGFSPQQFAVEKGGYLARYSGSADGAAARGGDVVLAAARDHSINPRLLVALLEYQSGWVTDPSDQSRERAYGYTHPYLSNLNSQLTWATSQLAIGYYGWRTGRLTELTFPDGSKLRLDPTLNAGTVAVQYFFAQTLNRPEWDTAVGPGGLPATYSAFFGDPFARAFDPLLPAGLTQVPLELPFARGTTWYFSGGPHGAYDTAGARAALDFAPPASESGCAESSTWVTAAAAGLVVRSYLGAVIVDLDGDGREATGWNILYLHVATRDRVKAGTFVETGDKLGHPSCEGGRATGTHVHIARKYNGEWIPADGVIPFILSGWVAAPGPGDYLGTLTREGQTVEACTCTAAWTAVSHR